MRGLIGFVTVLLISACNQIPATPEDQATAIAYVDQLRARDFKALKDEADASIADSASPEILAQMADLFPARLPKARTLIGASTMQSFVHDTRKVATNFEYDFGDKLLLVEIQVQTKDGVKTILGFRVTPMSQSVAAQHAFTFAGKGIAQYGVMIAAAGAVLLSLYAFVLCLRTKFAGRKWPWVLFTMFGFTQLVVNWTSGQLSFQLLYIGLFSAAFGAPSFGPVMISVSLPIGAIWFLLRRGKLMAVPALADENVPIAEPVTD